MTKKGIDVSVWNGSPVWGQVKASGIDFAILRAGYGREASQKDKKFDYNYASCKAVGMPVGVYWYNYAKTVADAEREADACLTVLKGKSLEYPVFYDLEENSVAATGKQNVIAIGKAFLKKIAAAGFKVGVYGGNYFANGAILELGKEYDVWIADYRSDAAKYHYENKHAMWQFSSTGKIPGINGNVDMDYCYKDYTRIDKPAPVEPAKPVAPPAPAKTPDVIYRVYTGKWWGEIKNYNNENSNGYAGVERIAVKGLAAKSTVGTLKYRVHTINGKWYSWVSKYDINDWNYGVAGVTWADIDGIQMHLEGAPGYKVQYRVSLVNGVQYLGWIEDFNNINSNGYAGIYGHRIDKVQIRIVKA